MQNRLSTYALLLGGMAIFGSGTPISKIVTEGFPPFLASGLRMLMAVLVLALVVYPNGRASASFPGRIGACWARLRWLACSALASLCSSECAM
ncbi:MAG: hypothetical protein HC915_13035 [Anaerolineae bacterium]|nr:hypothetical protein [Anaerolineae bacterium]